MTHSLAAEGQTKNKFLVFSVSVVWDVYLTRAKTKGITRPYQFQFNCILRQQSSLLKSHEWSYSYSVDVKDNYLADLFLPLQMSGCARTTVSSPNRNCSSTHSLTSPPVYLACSVGTVYLELSTLSQPSSKKLKAILFKIIATVLHFLKKSKEIILLSDYQ